MLQSMAGAALVAAHPSGAATREEPPGATRRFCRELEALGGLVDRFELINGHRAYGWVAEAHLPAVAAGDFHRIEHLVGWKTLLPCARDEQAIVACLRSQATPPRAVQPARRAHPHRRLTPPLPSSSVCSACATAPSSARRGVNAENAVGRPAAANGQRLASLEALELAGGGMPSSRQAGWCP